MAAKKVRGMKRHPDECALGHRREARRRLAQQRFVGQGRTQCLFHAGHHRVRGNGRPVGRGGRQPHTAGRRLGSSNVYIPELAPRQAQASPQAPST